MDQEEPQPPICQSCGMPMHFEEDFGTNGDGTLNAEYCRFCFKNGMFTAPDLTLEEQIERLIDIGVSRLNLSKDHARELAENTLPDLKRWQNKDRIQHIR